ncbi:hypothetical protein BKA61DRAFT_702694 [Leptodontidium sp. MPI-SDFR-AT-0119]|nr:hypothetical protein BKA61DRAFT_702694 [Leptodontidium sp. MPI-SDFR-AT-0119]
MNNLASLFDSQGKYEAAEPLFEETLRLSKKVLGEEHSQTLTSMNNLASLQHHVFLALSVGVCLLFALSWDATLLESFARLKFVSSGRCIKESIGGPLTELRCVGH